MVRSIRGGILGWMVFLLLVSVPGYFAAVHIKRFFNDAPAVPQQTEAERLRQARIEEFVRRNPKPKPAPADSFKEEVIPAEPKNLPPADEFAELRKLTDAQKRALTREHLYLIKGAIYQYRNENSKCPEKLEDLVPDYLQDMPPALIPGPLGTISKTVYNASDGRIAVAGGGGWSYNADRKHENYCGVRPNSSHYNTDSGIWESRN